MARIEGSFGTVSSEQIGEYEHRLCVSLPQSYRQFLLADNGGYPVPNRLLVPECGETLVDVLYGMREEGQPYDLLSEQEQVRDFGQIPEGWLRIGHDPGGNSLLLCTEGEKCGQVYYWDSAAFFEGSSDEGNTYPVAESIQALLASLTPPPEEKR
jgi:hypothetical protein